MNHSNACSMCDGRSLNLVRPEPIGYHRNGTEKPTYGKRTPFVQRCIVCQAQPPGARHGAAVVRFHAPPMS